MYVLEGGECKKKRFETSGHEKILGNEATIEFNDELLAVLAITSSQYKVRTEHSNGSSSWKIMGTKKSSFSYDSRPSEDALLIDGISKARIKYDY
jgi:hypothetical protein